MFPNLPTLPDLSSAFRGAGASPLFVEIGGGGGSPIGGGGGFPISDGGGGIHIGGGTPVGSSGGGGGITLPGGGASSTAASIGGTWLSSLLGIPAINWGRIAAFLLGLILIAGGIYLIRPVNQVVNQTVKKSVKGAIAA